MWEAYSLTYWFVLDSDVSGCPPTEPTHHVVHLLGRGLVGVLWVRNTGASGTSCQGVATTGTVKAIAASNVEIKQINKNSPK